MRQDAAGLDDFDEPEPESEPDPEPEPDVEPEDDPEPEDDSEDPLVEDDEPLVSEVFFDSVLGAPGEVAEDLPRLSVR